MLLLLQLPQVMPLPSPICRTARRLNKLLWKHWSAKCRSDYHSVYPRLWLYTPDSGIFLVCGLLLYDSTDTHSKMCVDMVTFLDRYRYRDMEQVTCSLRFLKKGPIVIAFSRLLLETQRAMFRYSEKTEFIKCILTDHCNLKQS